MGVVAVAVGAYLAAVFLVADARRIGDEELERYFALRVLAAAGVAGVVAAAGLVVLSFDADYVFDRLPRGALPLVLASVVCGIANLLVLRRAGRLGTRALAVGAVIAVVWAWGVAQHPYPPPENAHDRRGRLEPYDACLAGRNRRLCARDRRAGARLLYALDQQSLLEESR